MRTDRPSVGARLDAIPGVGPALAVRFDRFGIDEGVRRMFNRRCNSRLRSAHGMLRKS